MLTKEIEELERRAKAAPQDFGGPDQSTWDYIESAAPDKVLRLIAHIRTQDAEINGLRATLLALDVEITSLRETVRFLNNAVRVLVEAKL